MSQMQLSTSMTTSTMLRRHQLAPGQLLHLIPPPSPTFHLVGAVGTNNSLHAKTPGLTLTSTGEDSSFLPSVLLSFQGGQQAGKFSRGPELASPDSATFPYKVWFSARFGPERQDFCEPGSRSRFHRHETSLASRFTSAFQHGASRRSAIHSWARRLTFRFPRLKLSTSFLRLTPPLSVACSPSKRKTTSACNTGSGISSIFSFSLWCLFQSSFSSPTGRPKREAASADTSPMPVPPNAVALEPPPVTQNIRAQIMAATTQTSFAQPSPIDDDELNDYLALIAELALSYGGGHFYTYHKLFSAKCAVRVSQWNQCPYWGALDTDLHSRVFLGCRNISCAVCRSVSHPTTSCPQVNPFVSPRPETAPVKSTSYTPRPATSNLHEAKFSSRALTDNKQPCNNFNIGKCTRQRCRYLHICSFCGGAHARPVCPVYKDVNKKSRNYLSTPVNISRLSIELAHHPDFEFTEYLLSGLLHGFKPGVVCPLSQNIICDNLQSALAEPDVVDNLIKKEVESGFMIGPFDEPPFKNFRISPIGVATRKFSGKKRLIVDLSAPHKSMFPSINSLIPLNEFSLKYHDVDHAIDLIKIVGRGAWLAKIDITSAFKVMPIHPDSWHLFGVRWHEKFYFAVRLTFGCKSSPKIFDMLSEAVCWILSNNYAIPHLIHLLDDFLIISPPGAIPAAQILTVQKVFSELGIPIAQEKTMGPATSIEFLGINLDSVRFQASLPKEKIDRIILISSTLADSPECSKRELLSMLGHLNFAMRIIPQGRPFISHLLFLASSVHALEDLISITPACRDELGLWITFLKQWNGLSFFYKDLISSPLDIQLFTDAAPSVGFGGFYQGRWFASTWPPKYRTRFSPLHYSSSTLS
ncbi:proline-rich protein 36-like [Pimephales promelas]|nr:proline-rich protein 36-like [Pimephales promelas]